MTVINKYEKEIKGIDSSNIENILLNKNEKVRVLASKGIVIPPPSKGELITILFFLQFDKDSDIAKSAKKKFYKLPEVTIISALKGHLHKYVIVGIFSYLVKEEKQSLELFKNLIKNDTFNFNLVSKELEKLSPYIKTYLVQSLSLIQPYPKVMIALLKSDISVSDKQKLIDFIKRNKIKIGDSDIIKNYEKNNLKSDTSTILSNRKKRSTIEKLHKIGVKKFKDEIKYEKVKKMAFNPNEKIRKLASKGIIIPVPTSEELVSTLFFLLFDSDKEIAENAKNKFYSLPEVTVLDALKNELHKFVVVGIFDYLVKIEKEKQNINLFKAIIKNNSFSFNLVLSELNDLSLKLKKYLADSLSTIISYPKVISFLLKSEIDKSQKQKIIDFARRNNVKLDIFQKEKLIAEKKEKDIQEAVLKEKKEAILKGKEKKKEERDLKKSSAVIKAEEELAAGKEPDVRKSLRRRINEMNIAEKIQLAGKGDMEARGILIRQNNKLIVDAVIRSPRITDQEVLKFSADKNLPQEVIIYIANHSKWMRKRVVKMNIILNPKTPTGKARKLINSLNIREIKKISKMSGISGGLKRYASELVKKKEKKH